VIQVPVPGGDQRIEELLHQGCGREGGRHFVRGLQGDVQILVMEESLEPGCEIPLDYFRSTFNTMVGSTPALAASVKASAIPTMFIAT